MLLSRLWYAVLALVLGVALFILFLAQSVYNRAERRSLEQRLQADSQVVSWYLKADARDRAAHLLRFSVSDKIVRSLEKSNADASAAPPRDARRIAAETLVELNSKLPKEQQFDALFAIDQRGRVLAHSGYEAMQGRDDFYLGGYPVVGDALRGYVRDDTLVWERMYRVVARPVVSEAGQPAVGAILGARTIDDRFAMLVSERTGAAVAFFADGSRKAAGVPEGVSRGLFDQISIDLPKLTQDKDYTDGGRSKARQVSQNFSVVYAKLLGEAGAMGAGFAVGYEVTPVEGLRFDRLADEKDKENVSLVLVIVISLVGLGIGLGFSFLEHTRPLRAFVAEAARFGKGQADQLQPSSFRGLYRAAASDINDGVDHAVAKGGGSRRAADLKQVLGDLPDNPLMSAFSFPGDPSSSVTTVPNVHLGSGGAVVPAAAKPAPPLPPAPPPRKGTPAAPAVVDSSPLIETGPVSAAGDPTVGTEAAWPGVYSEFVRMKETCGEDVSNFTYEKFKRTLEKNQGALMQRHGVTKVKFSVYVKDGRAALKASPMKG